MRVKDLLTTNNADLLLLIRLERYERGFRYESGKSTHTLAVVRITKKLTIEYYKGRINHVYKFHY